MATDYDAPRRSETDDVSEDSLEELKARRNEAQSAVVDVDESESAENFELPGADLSNAYLTRANLAGANLLGANLLGANLPGINASMFKAGKQPRAEPRPCGSLPPGRFWARSAWPR